VCVHDVYTYVWHTWEWTIQWSIQRFPSKILRFAALAFLGRAQCFPGPGTHGAFETLRAELRTGDLTASWGNPGDVYSKQDFHRSFQWSILSSALGHTESWEWKKEDEGSITGITPDLLWLLRGPPLDMLYSSKNGWPDLARVWCWYIWNYSCWFYLYHSLSASVQYLHMCG